MTAPRFISHGMLPRARSLRSRDGGPPPTWAERLAALRYVPPLLKLVYQTQRGYTVAILALRAVRSFVPLSVLWVGKLIIDGVVAGMRAQAAGAAVNWWHLGELVGLELGIAVVGEALARLSSLLESLLGDLFGNRISVRLMQHAATLDLAQFEDAEVYDHLERARRQTVGRIGLFTLLLATAQSLVTLISLASVLLLQQPWLLLLLAVAVLPSFLGEAHYAALGYSLLFHWTPERRLLDYLRYMGASDESAKEVKLFGLSDFLVERYARLSDEFYAENKWLAVPKPIRERFAFETVGFRYPGSDRWAVRHLTFSIRPQERVALVGENGAGKTTLVKLLARLYDPDEGKILLDGVDLREYDLESMRRNIGVIFQDFVRYEFILKENIGVSQVDALGDEARIREAARRSLADSVAARLEKGYEQMLGHRFDGGVELSGGEWQKVALGRAYMREAQVLILDEPTAALDARAEYEVFLRFAELTKGEMAVLISHRVSTVRMADRIIVLRGGELGEQGTHEELLARGGLYAELFGLQAAGYR